MSEEVLVEGKLAQYWYIDEFHRASFSPVRSQSLTNIYREKGKTSIIILTSSFNEGNVYLFSVEHQ
jgi:hypothetical protein